MNLDLVYGPVRCGCTGMKIHRGQQTKSPSHAILHDPASQVATEVGWLFFKRIGGRECRCLPGMSNRAICLISCVHSRYLPASALPRFKRVRHNNRIESNVDSHSQGRQLGFDSIQTQCLSTFNGSISIDDCMHTIDFLESICNLDSNWLKIHGEPQRPRLDNCSGENGAPGCSKIRLRKGMRHLNVVRQLAAQSQTPNSQTASPRRSGGRLHQDIEALRARYAPGKCIHALCPAPS